MIKRKVVALSVFLLAFYLAIVMYVFFAVLHIEVLANFETGMFFEMLGFIILSYFVLGNLLSKRVKTGFFVPLIIITVIYTIILDVINMVCIIIMPHTLFVLLNIVLLFVYCLISMPMFIMGEK